MMWALDLSPSGSVIGIGGRDNSSTSSHGMVALLNSITGNAISLTNLSATYIIYLNSIEFLNDTDLVLQLTTMGNINPSKEISVYL